MPRRPAHRPLIDPNRSPFTLGSLLNLGGIPLITAGIMLIGWYFLTSDTLRRHEEQFKAVSVRTDQEKADREKIRNDFVANSQKTTEILGKLDTRLAISETKQETANQTLNKIADELVRLNRSKK